MTKKDYKKFAEMLSEFRYTAEARLENDADAEEYSQGQLDLIDLLIEEMCSIFVLDNPNFDRDKFRNACEKMEEEDHPEYAESLKKDKQKEIEEIIERIKKENEFFLEESTDRSWKLPDNKPMWRSIITKIPKEP